VAAAALRGWRARVGRGRLQGDDGRRSGAGTGARACGTRQAGAGDGGNRGVRVCGPGRVGLALWVR
jgi:hypothetical protein